MSVSYLDNYSGDARALLPFQAKSSVTVGQALDVFAKQFQLLEDTLYAMIQGRYLDYAVGAQLDGIGSIVGQTRQSQTDSTYRQRIKVRILVNRSSGTVPELLLISSLLSDAGQTVRLQQNFPAAIEIWIKNSNTANAPEIARSLSAAKPAGVRLILHYDTGAEVGDARFDSTDPSQGFDAGSFSGTVEVL